eukprot:COSAG01_NODE_7656_length_3112_cov_2.297378_3_plen_109_part_00
MSNAGLAKVRRMGCSPHACVELLHLKQRETPITIEIKALENGVKRIESCYDAKSASRPRSLHGIREDKPTRNTPCSLATEMTAVSVSPPRWLHSAENLHGDAIGVNTG